MSIDDNPNVNPNPVALPNPNTNTYINPVMSLIFTQAKTST